MYPKSLRSSAKLMVRLILNLNLLVLNHNPMSNILFIKVMDEMILNPPTLFYLLFSSSFFVFNFYISDNQNKKIPIKHLIFDILITHF